METPEGHLLLTAHLQKSDPRMVFFRFQLHQVATKRKYNRKMVKYI